MVLAGNVVISVDAAGEVPCVGMASEVTDDTLADIVVDSGTVAVGVLTVVVETGNAACVHCRATATADELTGTGLPSNLQPRPPTTSRPPATPASGVPEKVGADPKTAPIVAVEAARWGMAFPLSEP